jgi:hypothetical protein
MGESHVALLHPVQTRVVVAAPPFPFDERRHFTKGISAHHGGKAPFKHDTPPDDANKSPTKKARFTKPMYRSMKAAFASNDKYLQEPLKSHHTAATENKGKLIHTHYTTKPVGASLITLCELYFATRTSTRL